MVPSHIAARPCRWRRSLLSLLVGLFASGCALFQQPAEVAPPSETESPVEEADATLDSIQVRLAALEAANRDLLDRATSAELSLFEKEARILELDQQVRDLQRMLDETISEVVRTKAKLGTVESKAEAASEIAEAEIAFQALGQLAGGSETPEYRRAAELLERSADEFEKENYGGAIYLTNQAKGLVRLGQIKIENREQVQTSAGEVLFETPLLLTVVANSNVRRGPGLNFSIITTLSTGASVTGFSYKGSWVHVKLKNGNEGWIHQRLVRGG